MSIQRSIYFYNSYHLRLAFKKRAQCAFICTGYHVRAFDSSLVTYIKRDVLRAISNDIILVHFQ